MEGAYKNDIKQLTNLSTFSFTFIVGVWPRGITRFLVLSKELSFKRKQNHFALYFIVVTIPPANLRTGYATPEKPLML
jgi:hypothetical protein